MTSQIMSNSMRSSSTIQSLCRANMAILHQKLMLLTELESTFNDAAKHAFRSRCPMVGASIGQHFRHSLDHMELPALVLASGQDCVDLHYDLRVRGGTTETDVVEARRRIENLTTIFREVQESSPSPSSSSSFSTSSSAKVVEEENEIGTVTAHFMLSADGVEVPLPSNIERELGFAAHHAIHHMALVRLIATVHIGLPAESLPEDFGRAPSTVNFDKTV
eukprot:CAMPEP_0116024084 /NCGR_PEP_ID=MMETSP0321-20121206/12077_1 /TAXON_ID=163516 /ORGANISM="Leptocylindrus danicus var. danicus, Strain B650" /LENGTH=219 /DNA_ID=CAMNT_0003495689 /DNA_START=136 /DNA_END=795 /DNA_ORIENTATION=+